METHTTISTRVGHRLLQAKLFNQMLNKENKARTFIQENASELNFNYLGWYLQKISLLSKDN